MDKLVAELIDLLRAILATQERLLAIANDRLEAMRQFNTDGLGALMERERYEMAQMANSEQRRKILVERFRAVLGRGVEPTSSEIARRCPEPFKSQILGLAASIKTLAERVERIHRVNQSAARGITKNFQRILKIVTGVAQHAGVYMANGRQAKSLPVHVLDAVG